MSGAKSEAARNQGGRDEDSFLIRPPRFPSHALIDVRFSRWNPFARVSAVLIDVSVTGFKLQLVDRAKLKVGTACVLSIPLSPFGVQVAENLVVKGEIKWVDQEGMRAGGVFVDVPDHSRLLIERVIAAVISKGPAV